MKFIVINTVFIFIVKNHQNIWCWVWCPFLGDIFKWNLCYFLFFPFLSLKILKIDDAGFDVSGRKVLQGPGTVVWNWVWQTCRKCSKTVHNDSCLSMFPPTPTENHSTGHWDRFLEYDQKRKLLPDPRGKCTYCTVGNLCDEMQIKTYCSISYLLYVPPTPPLENHSSVWYTD